MPGLPTGTFTPEAWYGGAAESNVGAVGDGTGLGIEEIAPLDEVVVVVLAGLVKLGLYCVFAYASGTLDAV